MTFTDIVQKYFLLLEKYTPVLFRVHGKQHPELQQVRDIFYSDGCESEERWFGTCIFIEAIYVITQSNN